MSSSLRVLRFPQFRYLLYGQSVSALGDQVVIVALALYVTQRTGSATDLGLVLCAQSVSLVALLLLGGVWADRWGGAGRVRIMLGADVVRGVLHGGLAVLIVAGGASVAEMVVIETVFGAARALFQPAYTGLIPQTIDREHLQDAQALSRTTANLAILVGPALGAALVVSAGAAVAFAFDAATFALSAALLLRVRPRAVEGDVAGSGSGSDGVAGSTLAELRDGWSEVRSRPWVWATIAAFTVLVFTAYAQWYALAPGIARDVYGSASVFGVLESVAGGGAVLAALVGLRWRPRRPLAMGLALSLMWPAGCLAFVLALPLAAVLVLLFGAGVGFGLFEIWWETALARHIPPDALSRVSAYDWMGSLALLPVGFAVAGPLAAALGARRVLGAGTVIAAIMLLAALLPRSTRELGGDAALTSH